MGICIKNNAKMSCVENLFDFIVWTRENVRYNFESKQVLKQNYRTG